MKSFIKLLAALTVLIGAADRATADLIIVNNPSFEGPAEHGGGNQSNDVITSWTNGDQTNAASPNFSYGVDGVTSTQITGSIPNGTQVAFIKNLGSFGQDLGVSVTPGQEYVLTFYVAPLKTSPGGTLLSGTEGWSAQLLAGSNVLGSATGTVTDGSSAQFSLITITATAPMAAAGDLIIQFTGTGSTNGTQQVLFDDVTLTAVPEPSTLAMVGPSALLVITGLWRSCRRAAPVR